MHHAFVAQGDIQKNRTELLTFLQNEFSMGLGHNDVFVFNRGDFGIDDVQEIISINSRKPVSGDIKILIIELHSISHQAQNALLKTLEEPRPGTYIFILTNTASIFLPTILSRVQVLNLSKEGVNGFGDEGGRGTTHNGLPKNSDLDAHVFIKSSPAKRIAQIKEILDLKADEEIGDAEIFTFIQELEKIAHDTFTKTKDSSDSGVVAQVFTKVSEYMRDASSSKKLLLEYVALRLPTL